MRVNDFMLVLAAAGLVYLALKRIAQDAAPVPPGEHADYAIWQGVAGTQQNGQVWI